jgi:AcrR family transcriptional regulator
MTAARRGAGPPLDDDDEVRSLVTASRDLEPYVVPSRIQNRELLRTGREAIVKAAIELFAKQGFHATPVSEIAERAGLTIGALYKYVRSKHDILFLTSEHETQAVERSIGRWIDSGADPVEALRGAVADYVREIDGHRKVLLITYRELHHLDEPARLQIAEQVNRVRHSLIAVIWPVASPAVREDQRLLTLIADNLLLLVHMWAVNHRIYASYLDLDGFIELQTQLLLREIGYPGAPD